MPSDSSRSVTELLDTWGRGDRAALDALVPTVYAMLHQQTKRAKRGGDARPLSLGAASDVPNPWLRRELTPA